MAGVTVPPVIELEISESCSGAGLFGDPSFNEVSFPCRRPLTLKLLHVSEVIPPLYRFLDDGSQIALLFKLTKKGKIMVVFWSQTRFGEQASLDGDFKYLFSSNRSLNMLTYILKTFDSLLTWVLGSLPLLMSKLCVKYFFFIFQVSSCLPWL